MARQSVPGAFTASGQSSTFTPTNVRGGEVSPFNVSLWGTFGATVQLERTFDGGTNWLPVTALGTSISFTAPCTEVFEEPEAGVAYRLNCTWTSGTCNYRISQ